MNVTVDMQIACEDEEQPPPSLVKQWITAALTHVAAAHPEADSEDAEVTVRIVDTAEMQALNHTYRGKASSTNVLSFPSDVPDFIDLPLLGDIVVCAAVVNREAREQNKTCEHHWAHMMIHGCLHLLGYDHIDDKDAAQMETLEAEILATLQIANPYLDTNTQPNVLTL